MRNFSLIPFVCSAGGQVVGSERAGLDLQQAGLTDHLRDAGIPIDWFADPAEIHGMPYGGEAHKMLAPLGSDGRKDVVLWHCRWLRDQVEQAVKSGALPVTIGGDHSMALGSLGGLAAATRSQGGAGLIWIDAHADINTPDTSPSQALHGMPIAALLGMGDPDYVGVAGNEPVLRPEHLVYIGLRDVDPGEQNYISELGINTFTMEDIKRLGINKVLELASEIIEPTPVKALSIDLDAFDPYEVPSVGSPAPGGLEVAETLPALRRLVADTAFDLIEISEYNPALGDRERTRTFIRELMKALLLPA